MHRFLFLFFWVFCLLFHPFSLAFAVDSSPPESEAGNDRIERLLKHNVNYDLGFLWLDKVAVANFKLQKSNKPGLYIASLSAKTVGIAASLTNHRKQQYVSMMQLMPDGSFRSVRHTSQIEKGGVIRAKVYQFDYEKKEVAYQYFKKGKLTDEKLLDLDSADFPSDILTTYFNLVAGAYGPMKVGEHYEIPTFSKKGIGNINIDFIPASERPKKSFFNENLLICRVLVDQDVFDTKDGTIYIGYDDKGLPVRGIVADIIGLGDVRGVMK